MAYTTIDDPSAYFQVATYAGAGGSQTVTNDGNSDLKPDLVYVKNRSIGSEPTFIDTTRGGNKFLYTGGYGTSAEESANGNGIASFNTDGITWDTVASGYFNSSGSNFVAWQWKANGGTTANQTGSDIASVTQANTDAGFSIVTWTGNGSAGQSVKHGLGVTPNFIIFKSRSATADWFVYHQALGNTKHLHLNTTDAEATTADFANYGPNSTNFYVNNTGLCINNVTYIAYAFAEIQGYSKFGKYVGNGNANGPFVYTGFKPAFVILKGSSASGSWYMLDSKRDVDNVAHHAVEAQSPAAEYTNYNFIDMLSNGFKLRLGTSEVNTSGNSYIYMAFAENPFTTSTGVPTTAR